MPNPTAEPQAEPTPTPNDGTPTNDPAAALHWAAVALGLAEAREQQGVPLTAQERGDLDDYQNAARAHGHSDEQIRCYLNSELRPAATQ